MGLCGTALPRGEETPWAEKVKGKDLSSHPPAWMAGRRKVGGGEKGEREERLRKRKDIDPCAVWWECENVDETCTRMEVTVF